MLRVTCSNNRIHLAPRTEVMEDLLWALRKRLTVANPAYERAKAQGFSTWLLRGTIRYLEESETSISVPASFGRELLRLMTHHNQSHVLELSAKSAIDAEQPWSPSILDVPAANSQILWTPTSYDDDRRGAALHDVVSASLLDKNRNNLIVRDIKEKTRDCKRSILVMTTNHKHAMKLSIDLESDSTPTMALVPGMSHEQSEIMTSILSATNRCVLSAVDNLIDVLKPGWFSCAFVVAPVIMNEEFRRLISGILLQSKGDTVIYDYADPAPLLNHKAKFRARFYDSVVEKDSNMWSHNSDIKTLVTGMAV